MWDLPGPGLEPVSPALAGRFSTTAPPGKPAEEYFLTKHQSYTFNILYFSIVDLKFILLFPLIVDESSEEESLSR